ncbi:MAG: TIGR00725 family protein [candidate division Zixibacteria bacterium]|nr:TIGR00725 family protein [candidate division Zixibacteria bacterium]
MIAVCGGGGDLDAPTASLAEQVGAELAKAGAVVVCGGLGGVMEAVCRGARSAGGRTVGILPGTSPSAANPYIDVPIATGLSHGRNVVIVNTADGVIALPGSYGTLSEVALALKMDKPVVSVGGPYKDANVHEAHDAADAVRRVMKLIAV